MTVRNDQELNRYSISVRDFEKTIEFLKEALGKSSCSVIIESLLMSTIICYCRPFSSNERGKGAKATSKIQLESFSDITESERTLHEKCMAVRNKAIAHAEWTNNPTKRDSETNVICSRAYSLTSDQIDWQALLTLTDKLRKQCHNFRADFLMKKRLLGPYN